MKLLTGKAWCLLLVLIILGQTTVLYGVAPEGCACAPETEISLGAVGEDIAELQRFLQAEKLYHQAISGVFDQYTTEAVKAFQRRNRLAITGILDFPTWQALGQSAATTVMANPPPGDLRIIVDTRYLSLLVLVDQEIFATFPVAIGKRETPTPVGNWKVINKGHWSGGFGTRWIGLSVPFGTYGIHGTNKPLVDRSPRKSRLCPDVQPRCRTALPLGKGGDACPYYWRSLYGPPPVGQG